MQFDDDSFWPDKLKNVYLVSINEDTQHHKYKT